MKQWLMATTEKSATTSEERKSRSTGFGRRLAKFAGRLIGIALVGAALILLSTVVDGVLHWVTLVLGFVVLAGLALYANALSAETQRRLGPLPLGRPDQDLASMPLYQGRNLPGAEPDQRAS
jgi:membrane-associated phospholipid phosphatase